MLKSIEKEFLALMQAGLRLNIPDISIVLKWKKDFANFGLEALQPKQRGRPAMSDKGRKRKSEKLLTREEELLKETKDFAVRMNC